MTIQPPRPSYNTHQSRKHTVRDNRVLDDNEKEEAKSGLPFGGLTLQSIALGLGTKLV